MSYQRVLMYKKWRTTAGFNKSTNRKTCNQGKPFIYYWTKTDIFCWTLLHHTHTKFWYCCNKRALLYCHYFLTQYNKKNIRHCLCSCYPFSFSTLSMSLKKSIHKKCLVVAMTAYIKWETFFQHTLLHYF